MIDQKDIETSIKVMRDASTEIEKLRSENLRLKFQIESYKKELKDLKKNIKKTDCHYNY